MNTFELHSFNNYIAAALLEASNLTKTGIPKEMVSAIHQKEEHRSEKYKTLGYVNMGGRPVTLPYKSFTPSHDIEIPAPITFTGRKVPPPADVERTAYYTDFAQYLQDLPNGPLSIILSEPSSEVYLYLYYKQKWGGGPNAGGQQYAIIVWDREKGEAVDFGFVGLTTEGVEKRLVRSVHQMKGGNTNGKVQEYISSLSGGGPSRTVPVYSYELEVEPIARSKREERGTRRAITSLDIIRVFTERYAGLVSKANTKIKSKLADKISEVRPSGIEAPAEVKKFAAGVGASADETYRFLYDSLVDFRKKLWEEGKGAYHKTSGFDLEAENELANGIVYNPYRVARGVDPKDTRISPGDRRARSVDADKIARKIPLPGEYADIQSMIKAHTLDGVLHRYMFFMLTGRIDSPAVNVLALLGIDPNSEYLQGLPDFEKWVL